MCLKWGWSWPFRGVLHIVPASSPLLPHEVECRYGQATLQNLLIYHTAPRQLHPILGVSLPHWRVYPSTARRTACRSQVCLHSLHTWPHRQVYP